MGDPERALLEFAAAHHLVLAGQAQALSIVDSDDAASLLDRLVERGLLARVRMIASAPAGYVITPAGLAAVDSALPAPGFALRDLRQELAAGWVWARSTDGRFGGHTQVRSRRELIAHDVNLIQGERSGVGGARPFGVRVGGIVSDNASRLHHPDVLLMLHDGWAAVHVVLAAADPAWLASLLTAYGADERYGLIVFVVEEEPVAVQIERAAVSAGVSAVTSVQWMIWN